MCSQLTLQPHTRWLQWVTSMHSRPPEVIGTVAWTVHSTVIGATYVPEPTAKIHCTVSWLVQVVVTVVRGEHHAVVISEWISTSVTRVPSHLQSVVACLGQYCERTVLGVVPVAVATWLQVEPQLVAAVQCQLTEQFVAEPIVAAWLTKTDFKLRPHTVEEIGPIDVLLNQQRRAVGYITTVNISKSLAAMLALRYKS